MKSKSCLNRGINMNFTNKPNKKVIIDDDEEEENIVSSNKNSINDLYLPSSKINKEKINERKESIVTNEGSKFTLVLDNDNLGKKPEIQKQNTEKNKLNNYKESYDLLCISDISKTLLQIDDKLRKENSDRMVQEKCYEIINRLQNNKTDLPRRKKNTYLGILKILECLFSLLCDCKKCKLYISEIFKIMEAIQNYYKNVKKYDSSINNIQYHYDKKIAFKYIYSSLQIKYYDLNLLKELTKNNNNEDNKDLIKYAIINKRFLRTSRYILRELKDFKEKLSNPSNKTKYKSEFLNKYKICPELIQNHPNFLSYMKLFNHYCIVLNLFNDIKTFTNELEEIGKKDKYKVAINKRERSMQLNRNGYDYKNKNRDNRERSRNKEIEKEKEKNK